jgi:hypothetical protein
MKDEPVLVDNRDKMMVVEGSDRKWKGKSHQVDPHMVSSDRTYSLHA